jgi:hypothetical protein
MQGSSNMPPCGLRRDVSRSNARSIQRPIPRAGNLTVLEGHRHGRRQVGQEQWVTDAVVMSLMGRDTRGHDRVVQNGCADDRCRQCLAVHERHASRHRNIRRLTVAS